MLSTDALLWSITLTSTRMYTCSRETKIQLNMLGIGGDVIFILYRVGIIFYLTILFQRFVRLIFAFNIQLNTMAQAKAVLTQVAVSLAVAEKALSFEHRDLHWGNVLIAPTKKKRIEYVLDDRIVSVETEGIKVAVIDFTLSRLTKGRF